MEEPAVAPSPALETQSTVVPSPVDTNDHNTDDTSYNSTFHIGIANCCGISNKQAELEDLLIHKS